MSTKTIRYILYTVIIIICIASIIIGVYVQFFKEEDIEGYGNDISAGGDQNLVTEQDVKQSFLDLFTNEFYSNQYNKQITKIDDSKDLVYTAYSNSETVEGKYTINVNIPFINISGEVVEGYNNISQTVFADKISDIMANSSVYGFLTVNFKKNSCKY